MKLTFLGGAGEYGRSCFLLEHDHGALLIDCGVMKKKGSFINTYPTLTPSIAKRVSHVLVTHAHEDHTLSLPYLKKLGFTGTVLATSQTIEQTIEYFSKWRQKVETEGDTLPYEKEDEEGLSFEALDDKCTNFWISLTDTVSIMYGRSGHTIGSLWYAVQVDGKTVFFSGDYSLESTLLNYEWPKIGAKPDLAVMDGAYGDFNVTQDTLLEQVMIKLHYALEKRDRVLLQVPLVGKSQELLAAVKHRLLMKGADQIVVEKALYEASKNFGKHSDWLVDHTTAAFFDSLGNGGVTVADSPNEVANGSIGFFTAETLVEKDDWKHDRSTHIISPGPENQELKRMAEVTSIAYSKVMLKVHPGKDETEALLSRLMPKRTVFTHGVRKDVEALVGALHSRTRFLTGEVGVTVEV